jgi:superfamily II DNA or RNA helicase
LIGTTILDVGVDVPAVGMIILAGGGKAEVGHRQRIGRGLRFKKTGANVAFIVDFADTLNSHLRAHARQRRAIVEATPGFAENILADNEDFNWALFEKKAAA